MRILRTAFSQWSFIGFLPCARIFYSGVKVQRLDKSLSFIKIKKKKKPSGAFFVYFSPARLNFESRDCILFIFVSSYLVQPQALYILEVYSEELVRSSSATSEGKETKNYTSVFSAKCSEYSMNIDREMINSLRKWIFD